MQLIETGAVEVLAPEEQTAVQQVMERSAAMAGLSPWERHKIEWQVRRQRGELIVRLAELGARTVLAEATVTAEGRVNEARERAALAVFAERLRCLNEAGRLLDGALLEAQDCSEMSREWVQGAMVRAAMSFGSRMERGPRAGCRR